MKKLAFSIALGSFLAAGVASAEDDTKQCKTILFEKGERHEVVSHTALGTRLRFPGTIDQAVTSLPNEAWSVEKRGPNIWVRPKFGEDLAQETSMVGVSVVLEGGDEYDFMVQATEETDTSCYIIVDEKTALANLDLSQERRELAQLKADYEARLGDLSTREGEISARYKSKYEEAKRQIETQAYDAIEAFKYTINTAYTWSEADEGQPSQARVASVFDDGQFTYVRVTDVGFGVPIITARSGDKDYAVQYSYNDLTGVYQINGLFDRLHIKIDESVIEIERRG